MTTRRIIGFGFAAVFFIVALVVAINVAAPHQTGNALTYCGHIIEAYGGGPERLSGIQSRSACRGAAEATLYQVGTLLLFMVVALGIAIPQSIGRRER